MSAILESAVYKNNGSHDELAEFCFVSHPICYDDHGFCSFILTSYHNLNCFLDVITWRDLLSKHAGILVLNVIVPSANLFIYSLFDHDRYMRLVNAVYQVCWFYPFMLKIQTKYCWRSRVII